jgi:hypothetical protein
MPCRVQRCQRPPAAVVNISPREGRLIEAAMCAEHKAAIDAGDLWVTTSGSAAYGDFHRGQVILMDEDIADLRLRIVTNLSVVRDETYSPHFGSPARLVLTTKVVGSDTEDVIELLMTADTLEHLKAALDFPGCR